MTIRGDDNREAGEMRGDSVRLGERAGGMRGDAIRRGAELRRDESERSVPFELERCLMFVPKRETLTPRV